jgi:hypothetical protein
MRFLITLIFVIFYLSTFAQTSNSTPTRFTNGSGLSQLASPTINQPGWTNFFPGGINKMGVHNGSVWQYLLTETLASTIYTPQTRTITINGTTLDLSQNRSWTIAAGTTSVFGRTGDVTAQSSDYASFYVPLTRSLTINGVTQDLSANRSFTITVPTTANFIANQTASPQSAGFNIDGAGTAGYLTSTAAIRTLNGSSPLGNAGYSTMYTLNNNFTINNNATFSLSLATTPFTGNRIATFPNKNITVAGIDDIPDITGKANINGGNTFSGSQIYSGTTLTSSGTTRLISVTPTYSLSGTAGYKTLYVSPFESSIGSGTRDLVDIGYNSASDNTGTHTSLFRIYRSGSTSSFLVNTLAQFPEGINANYLIANSGTFTNNSSLLLGDRYSTLGTGALSATRIWQMPDANGTLGFLPILNVSLTTNQTSSSLNTLYPGAGVGQMVNAPNIGTGMIYIKSSSNSWYAWSTTLIP